MQIYAVGSQIIAAKKYHDIDGTQQNFDQKIFEVLKMLTNIRFAILVFASQPVLAYNTDNCCNLAKKSQSFIGIVPSIGNQTCGQSFSPDLSPARPLYVDYAFCSSQCGGMGLSKLSKPKEWAAPIVQFLLPSVIFCISIPRSRVIDIDYAQIVSSKFNIENAFLQMIISVVLFMVVLLPVAVDSVLWIICVVVGAGNMIISGLYEAVIDFRIVNYVKAMEVSDEADLASRTELLATLASGNLNLSVPGTDNDPKTKILSSLQKLESNPDKARSRLLSLIGAQSSFGGAVGSPVLFYIGAFVYNIIDLQNDPSDQDNAISLGFGIEWMIIVHVAIVSGTLLAANNPSTSSAIVGSKHAAMSPVGNPTSDREGWKRVLDWSKTWLGWSKTYDTEFQPVSIWSRGENKMKWLQETSAWKNNETGVAFEKKMSLRWWNWLGIWFLASLLIVIPPASGGVVAWATPPRGIACRSLSFIIYGGSQLFTTSIATYQAACPDSKWIKGPRFYLFSAPLWFASIVAAIGGTVMQISGVYRNCICYAGSENWVNIKAKNPMVQVANDTEAARNASRYWIWMGISATIFMAVNCYIGWWYQMFIRRRFTEAVENMTITGSDASGNDLAAVGTGISGINTAVEIPMRSPVAPSRDNSGLPIIDPDIDNFEMDVLARRFGEEEERLIGP